MGKILRISLKLNFTLNTLGCYALSSSIPVFRMKVKRAERNLAIFEDTLKVNHVNGKLSARPFHQHGYLLVCLFIGLSSKITQ